MASPIARFLAKVDLSVGLDNCQEWTGARSGAGYGQIRIDGQVEYATRWILGVVRGRPLGPGERALHHCDNPPCINLLHLYVGTQTDNMRDARTRGRANLAGLALGRVAGKRLGRYRTGPELCGTVKGYNRHRRHGEVTCRTCRDAVNAYNRGRWHAR